MEMHTSMWNLKFLWKELATAFEELNKKQFYFRPSMLQLLLTVKVERHFASSGPVACTLVDLFLKW